MTTSESHSRGRSSLVAAVLLVWLLAFAYTISDRVACQIVDQEDKERYVAIVTSQAHDALGRYVDTVVATKAVLNPKGYINDPEDLCKVLLSGNHTNNFLYVANDCMNQGRSILGNHLSRWYMMRLVAADAGISFVNTCDSPVTNQLPTFIRPGDSIIDTYQGRNFSWKETCLECIDRGNNGLCRYPHGVENALNGLEHAVTMIRQDIGALADKVLEDTKVDLDDTVVHVRIGDIVRQHHGLYGLVPFDVILKYIPSYAKKVGIVAAPFHQKRENWGDGDVSLNEAIINALREYLMKALPTASISVRNDVNESMTVAYARIVAAKHTFCGPSTFCLFPALASSGSATIIQSPLFGGSQSWLDVVSKKHPHVQNVNDPYYPSTKFYDWNATDIVNLLLHGE